jgi:hypothetical protein
MKELRLKMQELKNPTILTHHEIKNILGGSGDEGSVGGCLVICKNSANNWIGSEYVASCAATEGLFLELCRLDYPDTAFIQCTGQSACVL